MSIMVESLKRLYEAGSSRVTKNFLEKRLENRKITEEEYEYITGEKYSNGEKK